MNKRAALDRKHLLKHTCYAHLSRCFVWGGHDPKYPLNLNRSCLEPNEPNFTGQEVMS